MAAARKLQRWSRLGLLLLCGSSAACTRTSDSGQPSESTGPTAVSTAPLSSARAASGRATASPGVALPPAPLPVTPAMSPQLVACGQRDFYRITQDALQVFEVAPVIPPPSIRGSRVARQTTQTAMVEPHNVLALAGTGALVLGKDNVLRYTLGETQAQRYAPLPVAGPFVTWLEPRTAGSFWIRASGKQLRQYSLGAVAAHKSKAPSPAPVEGTVTAGRVEELTGFDSRLFTLLADGTPLFSTAEGLRQRGEKSPSKPLATVPGAATSLFADPVQDRYWTADAAGKLNLWDLTGAGTPLLSSQVGGVVIDAAVQGTTLAVLSIELIGQNYQPSVTIFVKGEQVKRVSLAPSVASAGQPKLDVCLLPDRPWVVVGGKRWLQLLDWSAPRLLAEW
jgi:hypothetical protein